ncbi:MAG: hypothetical protein Q8O94_00470 [bacterium]|nr:hypothetical protein [bacterium]
MKMQVIHKLVKRAQNCPLGRFCVCAIVKPMPPETKKSYNPFKMWGSYVGYFIFLESDIFIVWPQFSVEILNTFWLDTLLRVVLGFLIGWGIHSLFRKFSK